MYNGMNWTGFNNPIFREKRTVLFANGYRFVLNKSFTLYNLLLKDIAIETRLTTDKKHRELRLKCELSISEPRHEAEYVYFVYTGTFTFVDNLSVNEINVVSDDLSAYNAYNKLKTLPSSLEESALGRDIITKEDSDEFKVVFRTKLLETIKEALRSHKLMLSNTILKFFGIKVSQEDILLGVFSKPEVKVTELEEVKESNTEESLKLSQDYNNYELLKATGLIDSNLTFEEFTSKIEKTLKEVRKDEAFSVGLYNLLIEYKNTLNSYSSDTPREQVISDFRKLVKEVDLDKLLEE